MPPSRRRLLAILILVVAGAVLCAYWPVLSAQALTFDDADYLTNNPLVRRPGWASAQRFLTEVLKPSTVAGYYQPLAMISLMLDYAWAGSTEDLRPFHRTSLALHVANTTLVILLLVLLSAAARPAPAGNVRADGRAPAAQVWPAALAGLLFGLHPLTVEPVAWIGNRNTLLAAFFALATLCAYVRFTRRRRPRWLAAALVLFALSLLSKPTTTPLPLVMLLLDHWPLRRLGRRAVVEKIPFFLLAAAFGAVTMVSHARAAALALPSDLPILRAPLLLCYDMGFYLSKLLLPVNLSSVYRLPEPLTPFDPAVAAGLAVTAALAAALALSWRRAPVFGVGAAIFLLGLAPTMGLVHYSWVPVADKYVYLPAIGPWIILAWLLDRLWGGPDAARGARRVVTVTVVLIAAALLAAGTRRCLATWQDTAGRIDYMLRLTPDSPQLHYARAGLLVDAGQHEEALAEYTRAIALKPDFAAAYSQRGTLHENSGDYDRAIEDYTRAITLDSRDAAAWDHRGNAYNRKGDPVSAIRDYARAIDLRPDNAVAYSNRGTAFLARGDVTQAIQDYDRAIALQPDDAPAYNNRAAARYSLGDYAGAVADFTRCIALRPGYAPLYLSRANARLANGDLQEAVQDYTRALELEPANASAVCNRAAAWLALREYDKARADVAACRQAGGQPDPRVIEALDSPATAPP